MSTTRDPEEVMAEIEKVQQLAGHFPDSEALDHARRNVTITRSFR